jgi:hypothetical protein
LRKALQKPSETYRLVWHAVRQRQHILFEYNGRPRDACPVILGYSEIGREAVKVYQVGGATSASQGKLPAWRDIYLDGIAGLRLCPGAWREGDSHKRPQSFVKFVDVDTNIPDTLNRPSPLPFGSPLLMPPRA